jgi:hypothetical protein
MFKVPYIGVWEKVLSNVEAACFSGQRSEVSDQHPGSAPVSGVGESVSLSQSLSASPSELPDSAIRNPQSEIQARSLLPPHQSPITNHYSPALNNQQSTLNFRPTAARAPALPAGSYRPGCEKTPLSLHPHDRSQPGPLSVSPLRMW